MENTHHCNQNALAHYCLTCTKPICNTCRKSTHSSHATTTHSEFTDFQLKNKDQLINTKAFNEIYALRKSINSILDGTLCSIKQSMHSIHSELEDIITQGSAELSLVAQIAAITPGSPTLMKGIAEKISALMSPKLDILPQEKPAEAPLEISGGKKIECIEEKIIPPKPNETPESVPQIALQNIKTIEQKEIIETKEILNQENIQEPINQLLTQSEYIPRKNKAKQLPSNQPQQSVDDQEMPKYSDNYQQDAKPDMFRSYTFHPQTNPWQFNQPPQYQPTQNQFAAPQMMNQINPTLSGPMNNYMNNPMGNQMGNSLGNMNYPPANPIQMKPFQPYQSTPSLPNQFEPYPQYPQMNSVYPELAKVISPLPYMSNSTMGLNVIFGQKGMINELKYEFYCDSYPCIRAMFGHLAVAMKNLFYNKNVKLFATFNEEIYLEAPIKRLVITEFMADYNTINKLGNLITNGVHLIMCIILNR